MQDDDPIERSFELFKLWLTYNLHNSFRFTQRDVPTDEGEEVAFERTTIRICFSV